MKRLLGLALLVVAAACASQGPGNVGSIRGRAVDENGNALPGITVTLQGLDGKAVETVTTGDGGAFTFPSIVVGQYRLLCEFAGYTTPKPLDVTVSPGGLAMPPPLVLDSPDTQ